LNLVVSWSESKHNPSPRRQRFFSSSDKIFELGRFIERNRKNIPSPRESFVNVTRKKIQVPCPEKLCFVAAIMLSYLTGNIHVWHFTKFAHPLLEK